MKNKTLLPCKVVMLPTEKSNKVGSLVMRPSDGALATINVLTTEDPQECINQHLYFVSSRPLKENDYRLQPDGKIFKCTFAWLDEITTKFRNECKKIEATTDSNLWVSVFGGKGNKSGELEVFKIGQSFVEAFAKAKGEIKEIALEMNDVVICESFDNYDNDDIFVNGEKVFSCYHEDKERLEREAKKYEGIKTRQDNTVIIHQAKMYSSKEVILFAHFMLEKARSGNGSSLTVERDFETWSNETPTKEKSPREIAMQWWNNLSSLEKTRLCDTNTDLVGKVRRHETLTGREIEGIHNKENYKVA